MTRVRQMVGGLLLVVGILLIGSPAYADDGAADIDPAAGFDPAQVQAIEEAAANPAVPIRVVARGELPPGVGSAQRWAFEVRAAENIPDGTLVLVFTTDALPAYALAGSEPRDCAAASVALRDSPADAHTRFVQLVGACAAGEGAALLDDRISERFADLGPKPATTTTTTKVLRVVVVIGGVIIVGLVLWFRGRLLVRRRRSRAASEQLTASVSTAAEKNAAEQAKADLLALGSAIDRERMDEHDDMEAWEVALDAYAEAARIHDARSGADDDRRVIELCAEGMAQLHRANAT